MTAMAMMCLILTLTVGFFGGYYAAQCLILKSLKEKGRCTLGGDLYHVMLVNGEIKQ